MKAYPQYYPEISVSERILKLSDEDFEEKVLQANGPVLVDYWAEWCRPCKMIAPLLEEISKEYGDRVTVAKLNIDDNPATPQRYGVRGIPTLSLFIDGEVVDSKVGALSKSQLTTWLNGNL